MQIEGSVARLPDLQLDRETYLQVKKSMELIGGTWNRKADGFSFQQDPTNLIAQLRGGESRNIKKEFQFFGTPKELAMRLVRMADPKPWHRILEPSAGQGAIVNAIQEIAGAVRVECYELMELNRNILEALPGAYVVGHDFLKNRGKLYHRIIANPPFSKNQDIDHVREMYECLEPGGKIVTLASTSWKAGSQKKQSSFRAWLQNVGAQVIDLDGGTFKESGTDVAATILTITKMNH